MFHTRPAANPLRSRPTRFALALGALGVVFGDIGTSPLYALPAVFSADHGVVEPTEATVFGVISLVFWSITLIVSIKFAAFIMRADNDGEGGIMALVALVRRARLRRRSTKAALVVAGLFGVALFYGDGMITPAMSVLSAVEGIDVVAPQLDEIVLPLTLAALTGLFLIQRHGTEVIGRLFGPIMVLWFVVIAAAGVGRLIDDPSMLRGLSPHYALGFLVEHPGIAFVALGGIVLAVAGTEALYADMSHFGAAPIRRAWFALVFPALTLNYLGQGSLIIERPEAIANTFYLLFPEWARIPMVALATVATLIASQAVITGAFSVTRQAVQLGYLPRLTIRHTSEEEIGRVYVPLVNWALLVAVVALVLGFRTSERLSTAYGIAVTGTLLIDSILFLVVARTLWHAPRWAIGAGLAGFVTIDLLFLAANVPKIPHGGWLPLVVGACIFLLLRTWDRGREAITTSRMRAEGSLRDFITRMESRRKGSQRLHGSAIYLAPSRDTTPLALRLADDRIHALHERLVILTVETTGAPHVPEAEQLVVEPLGAEGNDLWRVTLRFGFQDTPDIPRTLMRARSRPPGLPLDLNPYHATWFLSHLTIVPDRAGGMPRWRKRLFTVMARNAASPADYFHLPAERVVTLGARIGF